MIRLDYAAIRAQIPIRRVLELLDWKPTRCRGHQWRGWCPLCSTGTSKQSSFSVHISRNLFQCFICRQSGNQLDLWAAATSQPLYPATRHLCRSLGIDAINLSNPQPRDVGKPAT